MLCIKAGSYPADLVGYGWLPVVGYRDTGFEEMWFVPTLDGSPPVAIFGDEIDVFVCPD